MFEIAAHSFECLKVCEMWNLYAKLRIIAEKSAVRLWLFGNNVPEVRQVRGYDGLPEG